MGVCLHGEACSYDISPDEDFIIDLSGEPNRLIVTDLSRHGFKFASVLGELAKEFACDKPFSFNLAPFSLGRFAR
nr:putative adenylyltransferase/sulfurtransferase MoeZ [Candidatus Pantoea persica]